MMSQRDINNIDKTILDNFYKLVHTQANIRLTAAASTYKILNGFMKKTPTKFNDNLNYCIDRLVAGLASSRALARRGYGTLLMELLKSYQVSTERLFSVASDKFGQVSRETSRDNLIAYCLLISIILESSNHTKTKANSKYVEKMYKILQQLIGKKSYMEAPITRLLMDHYDLFYDYILADVPHDLLLDRDVKLSPTEILALVTTRDRNSLTNLTYILKLSHIANHSSNKSCTNHLANMLLKALPDDKAATPANQVAAIRQVANIVRQPHMVEDYTTVAEVAKALMLISMFEKVPKKYNTSVKNASMNSYHCVLDHLISICKMTQRIDSLMDLVERFNSSYNIQVLNYLGPATTKELWPSYINHLKKHKQLVQKNSVAKQLQPITTLYLFYGLQIIEHGLECDPQLDELDQSSGEALKGDPNDGSWADVITDQIIAILSATECKPWIRKLCGKTFSSLSAHISPESIKLICDVLESSEDCEDDDASEGSKIDGSLIDQDEDSLVEDVDASDRDSSDLSDSDDDDASDKDEDETGEIDMDVENEADVAMSVDEEKPVKPYIENADEDDDEEYLTDEQMMKLDPVLADMFRMNRIGKAKKMEDHAFKLRCLDLIKVILEKNKDDAIVESILDVIIPLASRSKRLPEAKSIYEKVLNMLKNIKGKNKYPKALSFINSSQQKGFKLKKKKVQSKAVAVS